MTNTKKGLQNTLNSAKEALTKINQEKSPKFYASKEGEIKALEIAIDKEQWVKKTQKTLKELQENKTPKKDPGDNTPKKEEDNPTSEKKDGFDYGELAYLEAKKISEDCHEYLLDEIKSTGKGLKEVLEFQYIQESMNKIIEEKASEEAIPEGRGRGSGESAKSSVDYWVNKGELPPNTVENQKLRRDVVNMRQKRAKNGSKFADNPVVGDV